MTSASSNDTPPKAIDVAPAVGDEVASPDSIIYDDRHKAALADLSVVINESVQIAATSDRSSNSALAVPIGSTLINDDKAPHAMLSDIEAYVNEPEHPNSVSPDVEIGEIKAAGDDGARKAGNKVQHVDIVKTTDAEEPDSLMNSFTSTSTVVRGSSSVADLHSTDQVECETKNDNKEHSNVQNGDAVMNLVEAFITLDGSENNMFGDVDQDAVVLKCSDIDQVLNVSQDVPEEAIGLDPIIGFQWKSNIPSDAENDNNFATTATFEVGNEFLWGISDRPSGHESIGLPEYATVVATGSSMPEEDPFVDTCATQADMSIDTSAGDIGLFAADQIEPGESEDASFDDDDNVQDTQQASSSAPAAPAAPAAQVNTALPNPHFTDRDPFACLTNPHCPLYRTMTVCGNCLNMTDYFNSHGATRRRCPQCRSWYGAPCTEYIYGSGYALPEPKIQGCTGFTYSGLRDIYRCGSSLSEYYYQRPFRLETHTNDEFGYGTFGQPKADSTSNRHYGNPGFLPMFVDFNTANNASMHGPMIYLGSGAHGKTSMTETGSPNIFPIDYENFSFHPNAFNNCDRDGNPLPPAEKKPWKPSRMLIQQSFRRCGCCDKGGIDAECQRACGNCGHVVDPSFELYWRTVASNSWAGWNEFDIAYTESTVIPAPEGAFAPGNVDTVIPGKPFIIRVVNDQEVGLAERV